MPSETRWVDVPGGRLHVVADGSGPPILLVHAGIADLRAWDPVVPYLVEAGYRAVRYDTRGYERSTTEDVEFSNRADLRAVLDSVGVERAAFVGNSREDAVYERADALEESGDVEALADLESHIWVDGVGQPQTRAPAWIRDAVREMNLPLLRPERVTGRPIALDPPADQRLRALRVPTLAVVGAFDASATRAAARRLEEAVGARLVVLPDVAHMVGMEAPAILAGLIFELVRPLGTWA